MFVLHAKLRQLLFQLRCHAWAARKVQNPRNYVIADKKKAGRNEGIEKGVAAKQADKSRIKAKLLISTQIREEENGAILLAAPVALIVGRIR